MRAATTADEPRLREIAWAAKRVWGYDEQRLDQWARSLEFPAERETWVAEVDGRAVAFAALLPPEDGVCVLDDLWVEPEHHGRRIGTILFEHAVERARELGAAAVELEAEPNAVGFYERQGATVVGTTTGSWGRELPVMRLGVA